MNPRVTKVKPTKDFKLELTFSNEEKKVFDMKPYLKTGRFKELKNQAMFASVVCSLGSIQWQNGLDLCPDTLYEESVLYNKGENKAIGNRKKDNDNVKRKT
jgi:hypothetical protein